MTKPPPTHPHNRRTFLAGGLAAAVALQSQLIPGNVAPNTLLADEGSPNHNGPETNSHPVCIFAKHLQLMPWDELASFCRNIKVDGIEATVRRRGQVEPADAVEKLPQLFDAMSKTDTRIVIMATNVNGPQSPHAESVLKTAATLGVTHYRMEYYKYDMTKPVLPQLDAFSRQATELAAMNHDLGLTGLYQNHAGAKYVGAPLWDLQQVLQGLSTSDIAVAYDVRHATVEGNESWPIDLSMIRDKVGAVYVKDYRAVDGRIDNVSLGDGDVSKKLFASLRKDLPRGPVSLHMEYISHTDRGLVQASADAYRKDRETMHELLGL